MLMAGLDGVEKKIHPGGAMDKDLYALAPEELAKVPQVCGSLREALETCKADHGFLVKGNVFTHDFIERYIDLKMGRGLCLRTHAPPDRILDVLFDLSSLTASECKRAVSQDRPFLRASTVNPGLQAPWRPNILISTSRVGPTPSANLLPEQGGFFPSE